VFGSLGFPEIAFILILALLLFGPKRLPEIGRTVGKSLAEFRKASNELRRTLENEVALDDAPKKPSTPSVRPASAPPVPRGARELAAPKELPPEGGSDAAAAGGKIDGPAEQPDVAAGASTPSEPAGDALSAAPEAGRTEPSKAD